MYLYARQYSYRIAILIFWAMIEEWAQTLEKSYKAFVQQDHLHKTHQHLYENKYSFTSIKQSVINTINILEYNTIKLCLSMDTQHFSLLYKNFITIQHESLWPNAAHVPGPRVLSILESLTIS